MMIIMMLMMINMINAKSKESGIHFFPLNTHQKQASDRDIRWRIQMWMIGDRGFASTLMDLEKNVQNTMVAYNEGSMSQLMSYIGYTQFL
ncbi:hypothetical protein YC2023_123558 [Brassica napus]